MDEEQLLFTLFSIVSIAFGGVIGSFINVCAYRLPEGRSVISPGSRCPKCASPIAWYDNIPVISWVLLRAKCRECGEWISWRYPLVEAITAGLGFLVFWRFGISVATPVYIILAASLVLVTIVDLTDWIIPNEVTLPGIPLSIGVALLAMWFPDSGIRVLGHFLPVFNALIGVIVGGASLYLLDKISLLLLKKRGMGMGDVKLLAMLGGFFGYPGVLMVVMVASVIGSIVGVIMITVAKKAPTVAPSETDDEDDEDMVALSGHYLPFGPYLCLGGLVVMFFGADIYDYYMAMVDLGM